MYDNFSPERMNANAVAQCFLMYIFVSMLLKYIGNTSSIGIGNALGLALTDLRCFRTLRLKIRDPDIMYWN